MDIKYKELLKKYDELLEKYMKTVQESVEVDTSIKKMQSTLKSGGICDGLCGRCLLYDGGCLIHTIKGWKK